MNGANERVASLLKVAERKVLDAHRHVQTSRPDPVGLGHAVEDLIDAIQNVAAAVWIVSTEARR